MTVHLTASSNVADKILSRHSVDRVLFVVTFREFIVSVLEMI